MVKSFSFHMWLISPRYRYVEARRQTKMKEKVVGKGETKFSSTWLYVRFTGMSGIVFLCEKCVLKVVKECWEKWEYESAKECERKLGETCVTVWEKDLLSFEIGVFGLSFCWFIGKRSISIIFLHIECVWKKSGKCVLLVTKKFL